jgi:hypothetical protein
MYSLYMFTLLSEFFFVESKLVNKIAGHLLELIIRESLVNKNQAQNK